tara:strand:+ start:112 stop:360 length:249 start_codon:yes stop_codon:yes gene_type:complete
MAPNYNDRDLILSTKFIFNLKVDDVILLDTPEFGIVLKRISLLEKNFIKVRGDNMDYDSPIYNITYKKDAVVGKVLFKFKTS